MSTTTADARQQLLNGEKPCSSSSTPAAEEIKDEKYDKIWDKICALDQNPKELEKVTEEDIAYLFLKEDGNDGANKDFIKYCVKNVNNGDITCLAK